MGSCFTTSASCQDDQESDFVGAVEQQPEPPVLARNELTEDPEELVAPVVHVDRGAPKVLSAEIWELNMDIVTHFVVEPVPEGSSPDGNAVSTSYRNQPATVMSENGEDFAVNTNGGAEPPLPIVDEVKQTNGANERPVLDPGLRCQNKRNFGGLKNGFLDRQSEKAPLKSRVAVEENMAESLPFTSQRPQTDSTYSWCLAGSQNAKEGFGNCMLCLDPLSSDPREVVNLCGGTPRCICLLHNRCLFNPNFPMNDQLRRCMICKAPAPPNLVRAAVKARERSHV